MERRPSHPVQPPFPEGMLKTQAMIPPPHCPTAQDRGYECRCQQCDSEGVAFTYFSVTGALGQGCSVSTSGYGGLDVPPQFQPPAASPHPLGFPTTPVLSTEAVKDYFHSFLGHQDAPLSGLSAMTSAGNPPTFVPPSPTEAYSSPLTPDPVWRVFRVPNTPPPIGLEDRQMYWGVTSPCDPNLPVSQQFPQANLNHPTVVNDVPPTLAELSIPQDRTVRKRCGWRDKHGTICGAVITYHCQHHFATVHGITKLSASKMITCGWCDRNNEMKRECVLRHIREVHLRIPRSKTRHVIDLWDNTSR